MSSLIESSDTGSSTSNTQAKEIASGGGIVFAASLVDRGLRLLVTWMLSGYFGPEVFGIYTLTITILILLKMFSSLGTELGSVYFGVRFNQNNEAAKMKGLIIGSLGLSAASGIICTLALWLLAPFLTDYPMELRVVAIALIFWSPLHTLVGLFRAQKDMKSNALVYQITHPLTLLVGSAVAVFFEQDLLMVLIAYILSVVIPWLVGIPIAKRHFGHLFQDRTLRPIFRWRPLLKYSIPMALSQFVFRLNAWMDIMMLGWLASNQEVGIYRIAVSIAMISSLPINAIITIFNPIIVELVTKKDLPQLNKLLKLVTKWLLLFNLPILMIFYTLPDIMLQFFDAAYLPSQHPLSILIIGQLVFSACSIAMRIIPMSGYALLNLINGIVAAVVNLLLNYMLIPKYGDMGAAIATSSTLIIWSSWRLIEAKWLLNCFPFHRFSLGILLYTIALSALIKYQLDAQSIWIRMMAVGISILGLLVLAFCFGREPEDDAILSTIKRKFNRLIK